MQGFRRKDVEGTKRGQKGRVSDGGCKEIFCWEKSVGKVEMVGVAWAAESYRVARLEEQRGHNVLLFIHGCQRCKPPVKA